MPHNVVNGLWKRSSLIAPHPTVSHDGCHGNMNFSQPASSHGGEPVASAAQGFGVGVALWPAPGDGAGVLVGAGVGVGGSTGLATSRSRSVAN